MAQFKVTILATVFKTYTVDAPNRWKAEDLAFDAFQLDSDQGEVERMETMLFSLQKVKGT
jgi:hypothetical protein